MPLAFVLDPANLQVHGRRWQGSWRQLLRHPLRPALHLGRHRAHAEDARRPDARTRDAADRRAPGWPRRDARAVCALLTGAGHQALFVGGCVRNALLGRPVADIDIATDAAPRGGDGARRGRRAASRCRPASRTAPSRVVAERPALRGHHLPPRRRDLRPPRRRRLLRPTSPRTPRRRDFTMNALYARPDGTVVDPLGGLPDLRAGRVRFVGDPAQRIAEDYLRILRFFRFHAWYGDPAGGLDPDGLAACAAAQDGLARLSRERVGAEMTQAPRRARPGARRRRDGRRRHPRPRAARRRPRGARAARRTSRRRPASRRAGSAASPRSARAPTGPRRCASRAPTAARSRPPPRRSPPTSRPPSPPTATAPTPPATPR